MLIGWFASHTGRFDRIGGSGPSKLVGGGGDVVAHSSVWPSHGSSPAGSPRRNVRHTFQRNGRIEAPRRNAPMDDSRLRPVKPSLAR